MLPSTWARSRQPRLAWLLAVLLAWCPLGRAAHAAPAHATRFETVQISNGSEPPLTAGVWFPVGRQKHRRSLVVISHGGGGDYLGHADTAVALAKAGFVAAALSHAGDTSTDQSRVMELWRRPQQLHRLISYMLEEWSGRDMLNSEAVGAFGFSNGGFTVLVAAGGVPDVSRIAPYCREHPTHDLCTAIKTAGFDAGHLSIKVPPHAWVADGRIKAVVAAAPAFGFTFSRDGLSAVRAPVQLWRPADDHHQPSPYYAEAVTEALPDHPDYQVVPAAGHYAFLPPCSAKLAAAAPSICEDQPAFNRTRFHKTLNRQVVRFFRAHLQR